MRYTNSHEWIRIQETTAVVGISSYAQKELGDIVYVKLPQIGKQVKVGDEIVVLESTKAAVDVYSPVSGQVIKINEMLKNSVSLINKFPESKGWLFEVEVYHLSEIEELLDQSAYQSLIK